MNKEEILTISSSWFRTEHLVQPCQSGSLTWMQLVVEAWLTQTPQGGLKNLGKKRGVLQEMLTHLYLNRS